MADGDWRMSSTERRRAHSAQSDGVAYPEESHTAVSAP
jgi:hypothetical protein